MRRAWIVGIVLVVVALAAAGGVAMMKARQNGQNGGHGGGEGGGGGAYEPEESVQIVPAREIRWQETADMVGTVFAIRSVVVRNELAAVVKTVGFQSGDIVEAGQVLIQQDDTTDRADLAAVQAAVRVAEANIAQMDVQIKLAQTELDRLTGVESRAIAEIDRDRARTKLETSQTDRARWVAEVDQAKARVAQVEARLAKLTIRAPFRARAGMRTVHEGQYLAEGIDVVALQEVTDTIFLDFAIPQEYAPRVRVGLTVRATGELLGKDPINITVAAVDSTVNYDTRNLRVRAVVDNKDGRLVPGMFVQVRVPIDDEKTFVVVPSMAVRRAAYANMVFVIAPDDKAVPRAKQRIVTLGKTVGDDVIVLTGLQAGEQVGAAGSFKLRDGVKVMIGPPPGAAPGATGAQAAESPAAHK